MKILKDESHTRKSPGPAKSALHAVVAVVLAIALGYAWLSYTATPDIIECLSDS